MKIAINLGMRVRLEKKVIAEVPDDFVTWNDDKKMRLLSEIYQTDEGDGFTEDSEWGCEEASHHIIKTVNNNEPPALIVKNIEGDDYLIHSPVQQNQI